MAKTVDGVEIIPGLRVVDYDRKHGVVEDEGVDMGSPERGEDLWFYVRRDDGSRSSMNGSRLYSEKNYRPGL